jgi:predicted transcriptional regulator of viral defense system
MASEKHIQDCLDILHSVNEAGKAEFTSKKELFAHIASKHRFKDSAIRNAIRELTRLGYIKKKKDNHAIAFDKYEVTKNKLISFIDNDLSMSEKISMLPKNKVILRSDLNEIYSQLTSIEIDHLIIRLVKLGYLEKMEGPASRGRFFSKPEPGTEIHLVNPISSVNRYYYHNLVFCYLSALEIHGLSRYGMTNTVFISHKFIEQKMQLVNVKVRAVKHPATDHGNLKLLYGSDEINVTDIERTIIDCIHKPKYAAGWENVLYAIKKVNYLDESKLLRYLKALKLPSLNARVGYVMENLALEKGISHKALIEINQIIPRKPIRFFRNQAGTINEKWNLYIPDFLFEI